MNPYEAAGTTPEQKPHRGSRLGRAVVGQTVRRIGDLARNPAVQDTLTIIGGIALVAWAAYKIGPAAIGLYDAIRNGADFPSTPGSLNQFVYGDLQPLPSAGVRTLTPEVAVN